MKEPRMMQRVQPGKRILDLALAVPAMILLAPAFAAAALLVAVGMGTPVLFRQQRPGLLGRPFTLLKLRTMTDARDGEGNLKLDAERMTRLGRFLRKTSLDELPQLWNVMRGDMSLVGPRPLMWDYLSYYTPEQMRRHEAMPGITGWAQINGRNGVPFSGRLKLDVWYVDHWSLWLDVTILCRTFLSVLFSRGVLLDQPLHEMDDLGLHASTRKRRSAAAGDKTTPVNGRPEGR